jgi:hypothetical protein
MASIALASRHPHADATPADTRCRRTTRHAKHCDGLATDRRVAGDHAYHGGPTPRGTESKREMLRQAGKRLIPTPARGALRERQARLRDLARALRVLPTNYLDALAIYYGTDKNSQEHGYTTYYHRHFRPRRASVLKVLEIGVGGTTSWSGYETHAGGQSLRMWRRYFPNATIIGVDIYPKSVGGSRIRFAQGSQSDEAFVRSLIERYGPFDLVIDDGSHIGRDIVASFGLLWDAVTDGGFYVIEDLAASYDTRWGGGPPGTPGTGADLVKRLVDSTLRSSQPDGLCQSISAMHIYEGIAFLRASRPESL